MAYFLGILILPITQIILFLFPGCFYFSLYAGWSKYLGGNSIVFCFLLPLLFPLLTLYFAEICFQQTVKIPLHCYCRAKKIFSILTHLSTSIWIIIRTFDQDSLKSNKIWFFAVTTKLVTPDVARDKGCVCTSIKQFRLNLHCCNLCDYCRKWFNCFCHFFSGTMKHSSVQLILSAQTKKPLSQETLA